MRLLAPLRRRIDAWRFRYRLSICAIFKDEAPYLEEWLTFHEGVGVDHFYLYDNQSSDDFRTVLAPWIAAGKVTLTDWPGPVAQVAAYNHCLPRARRETRWLAFSDIDELLFSPRERSLPRVLEDYADVRALFVYWRVFGSSGHRTRPGKPMVEAYTWRLDDAGSEVLNPHNSLGRPRQGKSIVDPRRIPRMNVHRPEIRQKWILDEKRRWQFGDDVPISCDILRVNHYWSRSIAEMAEKVERGNAASGKPRDLEAMLAWERQLNAVEDRLALPLWEAIRDERRQRDTG
jgi:hypothetical protein